MDDSPSNGEDDLTIPRAAMNKFIKELCPNLRVATESRELILNCCTEFIHLVSSEANEICNKQQKKTINGEHVLMALDSLGYSDFRKDAANEMQEFQASLEKRRKHSTRLEDLGIPEEELLRQQQELFAKARAVAAEQEFLQHQQYLQSQLPAENHQENQQAHQELTDQR